MNLQEEWHLTETAETEQQNYHKPIEEEYSLYQAIRSGDLDYVKQDCANGGFGNPEGMGVLSEHPLTSLKYHFAIAAALIARHCIESGMEMEQSFRLSDFYILKMDRCSSTEEVITLHTQMCLDYAGKMRLIHNEKSLSRAVQLCLNYIYGHMNQRIDLQELSDSVGMSRAYLSRLFHQEVGVSLTDYIRMQKIEKAQNLLRYSDYDYIEIANYLGFSSQSHFIDQFRRCTGLTPKKYRDRYYHTMW